jgi:peptidylprolyl isomerase
MAVIAEKGNTVKVHYRGTLTDGSVFDESYGRGEPLEFELGSGMVIPGFDNGILGMSIGEKKKVFIPAEDAYGHRSDDMIIEFQKEQIPEDMKLEIGDLLQLQLTPQNVIDVEVLEIKPDGNVVFDANHRLADEDLTFEIELVSIA